MATTHETKYEDALPQLMAPHPAMFAGRRSEIPSELPEGWHAVADRPTTPTVGRMPSGTACSRRGLLLAPPTTTCSSSYVGFA
jgi:hypothetical protein